MKILAGSTMAMLVVPAIASAHGLGLGLNLDQGLKLGEDHTVNATANVHANANASFHRGDNKPENDKEDKKDNRGMHGGVNASTTAATIAKQAVRLQNRATFMASLSPNVQAAINGSGASASTTADANVKLADFNTAVVSGKTQATAVLTASTTSQGQLDLKAARDFLNQARKDLMSIFRLIWN
jgi:hypothetical protein